MFFFNKKVSSVDMQKNFVLATDVKTICPWHKGRKCCFVLENEKKNSFPRRITP